MSKKETIWRHILCETLQDRGKLFTQKEIALRFRFSLSTVFNALSIPRKSGAIEVTGRFFRVRDMEKLLLIWATARNIQKDMIYKTHVDLPPRAIERDMPPKTIFGFFSAYRLKYQDPPADYDTVYVYSERTEDIMKRFPPKKGFANFLVLKPDSFLSGFGTITPDPQTFVDLWNVSSWFAKDFLDALKRKMNLS